MKIKKDDHKSSNFAQILGDKGISNDMYIQATEAAKSCSQQQLNRNNLPQENSPKSQSKEQFSKHNIKIYTDGACSGNPGKGGWGAILLYKNHKKEISGAQKETTNNQMELMAVIESLKLIKKPLEIEIYTDSKYVLQGITEWIHGWKKNSWRTANKKPVKNVELWVKLDELTQNKKISWNWVKGHNGDELNERADFLARTAINDI